LVVGGPGRVWLARPGFARRAFTLIELILVLALLAMAVAVAAPALSRFFSGRTLDNEARRLLALTRYAQSRAVSEGMPMLLWLRPETRTYGLRAETAFTEEDARAVEYELDGSLRFEVAPPGLEGETPWKLAALATGSRHVIRFTPDGFVDQNSPAWVWLQTADGRDATWLVLTPNRLKYELATLPPQPE
jgi:type II secretion system protein H